jgi:hypothetical protein
MSTPNDELVAGVGQGQATPQATDKYDQQHGTYQRNVPPGVHLPNESPAGTDPSPFRIGGTK